MGWPVVEDCRGFKIKRKPANGDTPKLYFAEMKSNRANNAVGRLNRDEAWQDGHGVLGLIAERRIADQAEREAAAKARRAMAQHAHRMQQQSTREAAPSVNSAKKEVLEPVILEVIEALPTFLNVSGSAGAGNLPPSLLTTLPAVLPTVAAADIAAELEALAGAGVLHCAVLELAEGSMKDIWLRPTHPAAIEEAGRALAVHLLQLLLLLQSGQLNGCKIVHRDLKPHNVLLRRDGSLAVADFGLCCIIRPSSNNAVPPASQQAALSTAPAGMPHDSTSFGAQPLAGVGTPLYAAPEVYLPQGSSESTGPAFLPATAGKHHESSSSIDMNSVRSSESSLSVDVFAVGVLVLEVLVGSLSHLVAEEPRTLQATLAWKQQIGAVVDGAPVWADSGKKQQQLRGSRLVRCQPNC
eukprot:gene11157-11307_t